MGIPIPLLRYPATELSVFFVNIWYSAVAFPFAKLLESVEHLCPVRILLHRKLFVFPALVTGKYEIKVLQNLLSFLGY